MSALPLARTTRGDASGTVRSVSGRAGSASVLIMLLLHRNAVVSSERLIDTLWGEQPPATAAKVLQNYVGQLRRALDDREARRACRLAATATCCGSRTPSSTSNASSGSSGRRGRALASDRPADAAALLREALGLWRGPPLADVAYETFAQPEITRLDEQHSVGARAAHRCRPGARRARRLGRGARRPHRPTSATRAAARATDARPVSLRAPGGSARDIPRGPPGAGRRGGCRAGQRASRLA